MRSLQIILRVCYTSIPFTSDTQREKRVFNRQLAIHLFSIDKKPDLHIVYIETGFRNPVIKMGKSDDTVLNETWHAEINCTMVSMTVLESKGKKASPLMWFRPMMNIS